LSASAVVIHYEEALYQVYGPLPFSCNHRLTNGKPITGITVMRTMQAVHDVMRRLQLRVDFDSTAIRLPSAVEFDAHYGHSTTYVTGCSEAA